MKKLRLSVLSARNGSTTAVVASGSSIMSDSWICWNPRMDEPSNISPSVNAASSKEPAGTLKCCITPGRSQKRTSTNSTRSSRMKRSTSSGLLNIHPPRLRPAAAPQRPPDRRSPRLPRHVSTVSLPLLSRRRWPAVTGPRAGARRLVWRSVANRWTGSWLGGARAAGIDLGYPGERLGLPASGRGSVAGFGRRLAAYAVDSVLSNFVALAVFGQRSAWGVFIVFAVEVFVLTALGGASAGMRITRLRIVRLDGNPPRWIAAAARTALLLLLVPALIWDRDRRGLHDRAAGTVVVRV